MGAPRGRGRGQFPDDRDWMPALKSSHACNVRRRGSRGKNHDSIGEEDDRREDGFQDEEEENRSFRSRKCSGDLGMKTEEEVPALFCHVNLFANQVRPHNTPQGQTASISVCPISWFPTFWWLNYYILNFADSMAGILKVYAAILFFFFFFGGPFRSLRAVVGPWSNLTVNSTQKKLQSIVADGQRFLNLLFVFFLGFSLLSKWCFLSFFFFFFPPGCHVFRYKIYTSKPTEMLFFQGVGRDLSFHLFSVYIYIHIKKTRRLGLNSPGSP